MTKYIFQKFKQNIFILNYNDKENNIIFKKIIKIPITLEVYDINNEYNNYNLINKTPYKNYFENIENIFFYKNIDIKTDLIINVIHDENNIEIIINIEDIIKNNIISEQIFFEYFLHKKPKNLFSELKEHYKIDQLNNYYIKYIGFLVMNYNENNITLFDFINKYSDNTDKIIKIINKSLIKIEFLHNNLYFIHGDFKLNNILYDENTDIIKFIDLEFSIIEHDEFIKINKLEYINLYLDLDDKIYINIEFLKLFDIFLFTFTFFMGKSLKYNNIFITELKEDNIIPNQNKYYCIFIIIYKTLYNYSITKNISFTNISNNEFYNCCTFKSIHKILILNKIVDNKYIDNIFNDFFIENKINRNVIS